MLALIDETLSTQTSPARIELQRRLTTVVVDDSASFLEVICALLERDDEVDVVARGRDGVEAIAMVDKLRPDLVLMDIDMPNLDGLNASLIISRCFPRTLIVLMSAEESPELKADCLACGAAGFVCKTFFRQDFPMLLEELVAH
jgi:two-component system response regulator DesR